MGRTNLHFLFFSLLAAAGLAGCSRSTVSTRFQAPEFSLAELRAAPSLLVVSPKVRVDAFNKSYGALFKDTTQLSMRLSRKILDSLKLGAAVAVAPAGMAATDSALRGQLVSTGSTYVIRVSSVTIADSVLEIPDILLPGPGSGTMQPTRGGQGKACIVTLNVEILDAALRERQVFTVRSQADVPLYAYKTALLNALDGAARRTAFHLVNDKAP